MAMQQFAPFHPTEKLALLALTCITIYSAWNGVSGWGAMLALVMTWGGGLMCGFVIATAADPEPDFEVTTAKAKRK